METPEKKDFNSSSLTPVRTPNTPTTSTTSILTSRLAQIVKQLQDNCTDWEYQRLQGSDAIKGIVVNNPKDMNTQTGSHYNANLKRLADQLCLCSLRLEDILKSTEKCLAELNALWALSGHSQDVQSKSWTLEHYIKWTAKTLRELEEEYAVKKVVMQEIPHAIGRQDLETHRCLWEYPDKYLVLHFKFIFVERG